MAVCPLLGEAPRAPVEQLPDTNDFADYDFMEKPSRDFFCPVTLELLIEPLQTTCCGNHLSKAAASKLHHDGKPCPMCKHPQFNTVEDKYMQRKVNSLRIRCPYSKSGCGWEGEMKTHTVHLKSCVKRPWNCDYCDYCSTYDDGPSKHILNCAKYPVVCPNTCETFMVPHSELQIHLMTCPLQLVSCKYAEIGCDVKVPRRDLTIHMEESQQQHLMSATLLNIRLTRESLAEKDRTIAAKDEIISEKDKIIVEKDKVISEKDEVIAAKDKELADKSYRIADLELQLQALQCHSTTAVALEPGAVHVDADATDGFLCHKFTVSNVSKCQKIPGGNWYSKLFYSHLNGYNLKLLLKTNGDGPVRGTHMSLKFACNVGENDEKLQWPVEFEIRAQVLNQLGDHTHHIANGSVELCSTARPSTATIRYNRAILKLIALDELVYNANKNTHYLKDDCLHLQVHLKQLK